MLNFSELLGLNIGKNLSNAEKSETMTPAEKSLWQNLKNARRQLAQPNQDKFSKGLQPSSGLKASVTKPQLTNKQVASERSGLHVSEIHQSTSHANSETASSNVPIQIPERYTQNPQQAPSTDLIEETDEPPSYAEVMADKKGTLDTLPVVQPQQGAIQAYHVELPQFNARHYQDPVELPGSEGVQFSSELAHSKPTELNTEPPERELVELPGSEGTQAHLQGPKRRTIE